MQNMTTNWLITITDKVYNMLRQEYQILFFSPFGSWNYWLAKQWKSDFDFIAVIIPNKYSLINRTVINKTVEHNFWTWWKIDIKDIYTFFKSIKGLNYLEALMWTQYRISKSIPQMRKLEKIIKEYIKDNRYVVAKRIEAQLVNNAKKVLKLIEGKNNNKDIDETKLRKLITECIRLDNILLHFITKEKLKFKLDDDYIKKIMNIRYWKSDYNKYLQNIFNIAKFGSIIPEHWKDNKKNYKAKFRNIRNEILLKLEICK